MNTSNDVQSKADLIVRLYLKFSDANSRKIADIVNCHSAYVRAVIRRRGYVGFENRKYTALNEKT